MGKAEETKQAIIEKAAVIFNKNGYQRTTISMLTEALNLTKGSIYGNFADKDELAVEAFRFSMSKVYERITPRLLLHDNPVDKLRALARTFIEFFEDMRKSGGCPILNTAVDSDDAHPKLLREVRAALDNWKENMVRLVAVGMESGAIRSDADPETFAANFIALIEGGILLAKTMEDRIYLEQSVQAINLLIDGLLAKAT